MARIVTSSLRIVLNEERAAPAARRRKPIDWTKVTAIAADELGQHYLTLVSDLEAGRILWSKESRSAATLEAFFDEIGVEACARLRQAAIDMLESYVQAIRRVRRGGRSIKL